MTQLHDPLRLKQIALANPEITKTKGVQDREKSLDVRGSHPDEKSDVTRKPRVAMECHGVANNEVFNSMRVQ